MRERGRRREGARDGRRGSKRWRVGGRVRDRWEAGERWGLREGDEKWKESERE